MVTVLGHHGMLGSVVARRWAELGADDDDPLVVCCIAPDDLRLLWRLAALPGLVAVSSDAIVEPTHYAAGKRAVESIPGAVVIRSGLVDIRKRPSVAWANWYANPLTPLEWADFAWERRYQPGVHIAGRAAYSRYDIVRMIAEVFGGPEPMRGLAPEPLDRTQPPDRDRPPLRDALVAYRDWLG